MDTTKTIRVVQCQASDECTQKCHMGPNIFKALQLKLGQCVTIIYKSKKYICKAWIRKDKHDEYIDLDQSVYDANYSCRAGLNSASHIRMSDIEPQNASHFKDVEIKLIMYNCEDVLKVQSTVKLSDKTESLERLLETKFFSDGCVIMNENTARNGVYCVNIVDTSRCRSLYGFATANSKVVIKTVISKDRYTMSTLKQPALGGLSRELTQLTQMIEVPLLQGEMLQTLGMCCPKSVLLRGPPGCGKTTLVKRVSYECNALLLTVVSSNVIGSRPGETEQALKGFFQKAKLFSREGPVILFLDELDSFCGKRNREQKVLAQLCQMLDQVQIMDNIVVIGATNRPSALDAALRRAGRFDREVFIGIPSQNQREDILKVLLNQLPLDSSVSLCKLSEATPGFVGADLKALIQQAYYIALERDKGKVSLDITHNDLQTALHVITPSTQRGSDVLVDTKPVQWSDIGGLTSVKDQVKHAIELPLTHPEAFARLGLSRPKGVLLYGPPGCAKTTLVRAAATACHVTFLSISGAQLYSPFVGDSEKKISEVFQQARAGAPCILFIDEIDSVVGSRSKGSIRQGGVQERVLSTLLNEMDGIGLKVDTLQNSVQSQCAIAEGDSIQQKAGDTLTVNNHDVLIVAATNRPDMLDDALLRPGRIDKLIYVPTPDEQGREQILKIHTRQMSTEGCLDLKLIAARTEYFSGADLENLCKEAALHALSVEGPDVKEVKQEYFTHVLEMLKPSLSQEQLAQYQKLTFR